MKPVYPKTALPSIHFAFIHSFSTFSAGITEAHCITHMLPGTGDVLIGHAFLGQGCREDEK